MTTSPSSEWGDLGRYYATDAPGTLEVGGGRVQKALEQAAPGTQDAVERTCQQWNMVIRDALRSEMALRLTYEERTQAIPVKVVDGLPPRFARAMQELAGLEWLLLHRAHLEGVVRGATLLEQNIPGARERWHDAAGPADAGDAARVRETAKAWLQRLDELQVLQRIVGGDEDVLGAYWFRIPEIRIYWVVVGVTAQALGLSPQALTVVVLAHELAHAYSHLGFDIDGARWDTDDFANASLDIVEGLAQFYAEAVCRRVKDRMPSAMEAYVTLLQNQQGPYHAHLGWGPEHLRAGEILRATMLACRVQGLRTAAEFEDLLGRHRLLNHRP